MQEKQILDRISKTEQRIVDLYRRLTGAGSGTATLPYKSYVALISQSGGSVPTEDTLLENTIGTISYSIVGAGEYNINSSGLFTAGKTVIFLGPGRYTTGVAILGTTLGGTSSITIYSRNTSNIGVNGLMSSVPVEIRVYN
jgi:hypothetical protein